MLSVAKLKLGQDAYYEQQVARGLDDYYAGRGESPGIWAGSGAGGLGLVGVVGDGDLGTLLRGVNPANGERLREPESANTSTAGTAVVAPNSTPRSPSTASCSNVQTKSTSTCASASNRSSSSRR